VDEGEAHVDRGILLQRLGRHAEALEDYEAAIAWGPPCAEAHFNRAQALMALARPGAARAEFDRLLTLEPEDVGALVGRAGVLLQARELAAARQDVERALALDPRQARACCLLGLLEMEERRWEQAGQAFDRALASDDSETAAWVNRATLRLRAGDPQAALGDLGEAIRRKDDVAARYNRGRILQLQRRWQEALADYDRALELSSGELRDAAQRRELCRRALRAEVKRER
jgi:tetratricopeptide (TPR) repeat protein